jgi:4-amino-4-deoxy-L-arabinose transferase-like glycosyltransferase
MRISPEFYEQVVQKEFLGRFTVGEKAVHNNQIIVFYFGHLLLRFAPWSLLLIAFLCVKRVREAFRTDPELLWLACWALGGLIFMSLVPSKRFDRILPVVPPLCLLIVAMGRHLPQFQWRGTPLGALAILSAMLACLTSGAYAGWEMWKNFRDDQGGLARFGRQVALHTAGRTDRLVVISGKDEGLLLYTGVPRFGNLDEAVAMWRFGRIDWMVLPLQTFAKQADKLGTFKEIAKVPKLPEKSSGYILLERPPAPAGPEAGGEIARPPVEEAKTRN